MGQGIPKLFHYVWMGSSFPRLNILSIASLRRMHPDASIIVHFVDSMPNDESALSELVKLDVELQICDPKSLLKALPTQLGDVEAMYRKIPPTAFSARSNVIRYAILYVHGGIYLDLDTIALRPFEELLSHRAFIGEEIVWRGDALRVQGLLRVYFQPSTWVWVISRALRWMDCRLWMGQFGMSQLLCRVDKLWQQNQVNNAVIGAELKSDFIADVIRACINASPTTRYATGPLLVDAVVRNTRSDVCVLHYESFYAVAPGESFRLFQDITLKLPENSVVIHFASSNHSSISASQDPLEHGELVPGSQMFNRIADLEDWLAHQYPERRVGELLNVSSLS